MGSCRGSEQILIGLDRVGIAGLREAFGAADAAAAAGAPGREELVDALYSVVARSNYVPLGEVATYRTALWREYLRHRGEDLSAFFSEIDVVVRGEPGARRERLVEILAAALARHELQPRVAFEPPDGDGRDPKALLRGEVLVAGPFERRDLERAVRAGISDW